MQVFYIFFIIKGLKKTTKIECEPNRIGRNYLNEKIKLKNLGIRA